MNTEDYIRELKLLAYHIQELHQDKLEQIGEPVLLAVELPNFQRAYFLVSSEGIRYEKEPVETKNRISLRYTDLIRVIEKPSRIIRYIMQGRIKVSGNYREVISTLQKLF